MNRLLRLIAETAAVGTVTAIAVLLYLLLHSLLGPNTVVVSIVMILYFAWRGMWMLLEG